LKSAVAPGPAGGKTYPRFILAQNITDSSCGRGAPTRHRADSPRGNNKKYKGRTSCSGSTGTTVI
jgi:hypothetical protein